MPERVGGPIHGPAGTSDSVPLLLSGCDYRLSAEEVRAMGGPTLKRINEAFRRADAVPETSTTE